MMTTMAALLGALPLALGTGTGAELRRPLGITIVGGLIVSPAPHALHHAGRLSLPRAPAPAPPSGGPRDRLAALARSAPMNRGDLRPLGTRMTRLGPRRPVALLAVLALAGTACSERQGRIQAAAAPRRRCRWRWPPVEQKSDARCRSGHRHGRGVLAWCPCGPRSAASSCACTSRKARTCKQGRPALHDRPAHRRGRARPGPGQSRQGPRARCSRRAPCSSATWRASPRPEPPWPATRPRPRTRRSRRSATRSPQARS